MYASQVGHEESVRTLIEKGASLDAVDKEHGWTPLDWAVHKCSEEAAAVLHTHGARHSTNWEREIWLRGLQLQVPSHEPLPLHYIL